MSQWPTGKTLDKITEGASKNANTDIFSSDLTPSLATDSIPSVFRVTVGISAGQKLKVRKVTSGTYLALNNDQALSADTEYALNIPVRKGDKINFQFDGAVTVREFRVDEILAQSE